jgi:RNase P subunit RPR2
VPEGKKLGRLRRLYLTVACALCGSGLRVTVPENVYQGQVVTVWCIPCGHEMKIRITAEDLVGIDGKSS